MPSLARKRSLYFEFFSHGYILDFPNKGLWKVSHEEQGVKALVRLVRGTASSRLTPLRQFKYAWYSLMFISVILIWTLDIGLSVKSAATAALISGGQTFYGEYEATFSLEEDVLTVK